MPGRWYLYYLSVNTTFYGQCRVRDRTWGTDLEYGRSDPAVFVGQGTYTVVQYPDNSIEVGSSTERVNFPFMYRIRGIGYDHWRQTESFDDNYYLVTERGDLWRINRYSGPVGLPGQPDRVIGVTVDHAQPIILLRSGQLVPIGLNIPGLPAIKFELKIPPDSYIRLSTRFVINKAGQGYYFDGTHRAIESFPRDRGLPLVSDRVPIDFKIPAGAGGICAKKFSELNRVVIDLPLAGVIVDASRTIYYCRCGRDRSGQETTDFERIDESLGRTQIATSFESHSRVTYIVDS